MTQASPEGREAGSATTAFTWPHEGTIASLTRSTPTQIYTRLSSNGYSKGQLGISFVWKQRFRRAVTISQPMLEMRPSSWCARWTAASARCSTDVLIRGAVLCYKLYGNISEFNCVYHNWVYNLDGKLTGRRIPQGCWRERRRRRQL